MEQTLFLQYLLFGLGALALLALIVPLMIWRNGATTARLLAELLEEQENTNLLLGKLLRRLHALGPVEGAPGPDEDYGPDEECCADEAGQAPAHAPGATLDAAPVTAPATRASEGADAEASEAEAPDAEAPDAETPDAEADEKKKEAFWLE